MKKLIYTMTTTAALGLVIIANLNAIGSFKDVTTFDYLDRRPITAIKMQAEAKNKDAMYTLGVYYYYIGQATKAYEWIKKSADLGNPYAQDGVARMYYFGDGTPFNLRGAFTYFLMAAQQNLPINQGIVGKMYLKGFGTPVNVAEGIRWLEKASLNKERLAPYILGAIYSNGEIVEKNKRKAIECFVKAAQNGNDRAFTTLKNLHYASLRKCEIYFEW